MTDVSVSVNITVNSTTGAQPTDPATLNANLIALVASINPDYTVLPAGLIEDLSSTATYSLAQIEQMVIDLINSIAPSTANPWLLIQQGEMVGVTQGSDTNTSVEVVFTLSPNAPGFVIAKGVIVSDGANQYVVQDAGAVGASGSTQPLFCLASAAGSFAVPANTVNQISTSVPGLSPGQLTCTNPTPGTPGAAAQTEGDYRAQVLLAWRASAQGMGTYLRTLLEQVPGVQARLISVNQQAGGGWEIIVGGGDQYQVAQAILQALFDISNLVGSTLGITAVTNANPGVVTTNLNHGLTNGQTGVNIAGVLGMTGVNGGPYTVTVLDEKRFSFGVNTTTSGTYGGGGGVTPNNRNVSVSLSYPPDTYNIVYVQPPQQSVTIQLVYKTTSVNFVSAAAVASLGGPAIVDYLNSITVGQPINQYAMEQAFTAAIINVLPANLISEMDWTVSVNGVEVSPVGLLYNGDPESFFFATASDVTITAS